MFKLLHFFMSITIIVIILYFSSFDRKNINFRYVIQLLIIEIFIAYLLLRSPIGIKFIQVISVLFEYLIQHANVGTSFVFGPLFQHDQFVFFFNVLMPIILISALIGLLQYFKFLNFIIKNVGNILSKFNGMGKLESFNAISSIFLGQSENFIAYKNIINKISKKRMYTMSATAMSTVSLAIVGSYMKLIEPKFIISSIVLNLISTFIVLHIINPYDHDKEIKFEDMYANHNYQTFFEILSDYILAGFKVAITVAAMLIGFIALIHLLNDLFFIILSISLQDLLGYFFAPCAWLIGIESKDIIQIGSIMAMKLVSNEFVAMIFLKNNLELLSTDSIAIISIFLVSFANFSSIGIIVGSVQALDKDKAKFISQNGWRLVLGSTIVSFISAVVSSLVI